jgi:hypothetical protein
VEILLNTELYAEIGNAKRLPVRIHIYYIGPKRDDITGEWRKLIIRSLMSCTAHPILCG